MFLLIIEAIFVFLVEIFVLCFVFVLVEKKRPFIKTRNIYKYNPYTFIRSVLLQTCYDIVNYDPEAFPYTGIIIYEGTQGKGKTISMVYDTLKMLKEYPRCWLVDNLGIAAEGVTNQQYSLSHWKDLIDIKNGKYGIVTVIDETQLWFSNKDSKNFDPSALQIICQNRKNRRIILGSCQRFYLMAKDLRMQCSEVRSCFHIGPITGYIRKIPILDTSGELKQVRFKGIRLFVQSLELREAYDTYKILTRISSSGFVDPQDNILRKVN